MEEKNSWSKTDPFKVDFGNNVPLFCGGPFRIPLKRIFADSSGKFFDVCYFGVWPDP